MRRPQDLVEQLETLTVALRGLSPTDAASVGVQAGRPVDGSGGGRVRPVHPEAPYTAAVAAAWDTLPLHVRLHLAPALRLLKRHRYHDYVAVQLIVVRGLRVRTAGTAVGLGESAMGRRKRTGLEFLAAQLWTDNYEPRLPSGPEGRRNGRG